MTGTSGSYRTTVTAPRRRTRLAIIGGLPVLPPNHYGGGLQSEPQSPPQRDGTITAPAVQTASRPVRTLDADAVMREVLNETRSHEDPANFPINLPEPGSGTDQFSVTIPQGLQLAHVDIEFQDLTLLAKAGILSPPARGSTGNQRIHVRWSHPPYGKVAYRLRVWASTDGTSQPVMVDHDETGFEIRSKLLLAQSVPVNARVVGQKAAMLNNAIEAQRGSAAAQTQELITAAVIIVLILAAVVVVGMIVLYAVLHKAMEDGYDVEDTKYKAAVGEGETRQEHEMVFNLRKPTGQEGE